MENISTGPIFTAYSEGSAGVSCIRAHSREPIFIAALEVVVEDNMRIRLANAAVQQWLALRLQLISALIVAVLAGLGVASAQGRIPPWLSGGGKHAAILTSLSLTYALPLVGLLNGLLMVRDSH